MYAFLFAFLFMLPANRVMIIKQSSHDCFGLSSVVYLQDGHLWALDYITPRQIDSLKNCH